MERVLRGRAWGVAFIGAVVGLTAAFVLAQQALDGRPTVAYTPRIIPVRGIEALRFSGWRAVLADMFYIRAGLSLSDEAPWAVRLRWVWAYAGAALRLDPGLTDAYFLGGVVAPRTPEQIRLGIRFLKRHRRLNPKGWRVLYWIGFDHLQLQEYRSAARFYRLAARLPGSPEFLRSNPAMMAYLGNDLRLGLAYLDALQQRVTDERQREWIRLKKKWMALLLHLQEAAERFRRREGRYPLYLDELVERGAVRAIPDDPFGDGFYWDPDERRVKSLFLGISRSPEPKPSP